MPRLDLSDTPPGPPYWRIMISYHDDSFPIPCGIAEVPLEVFRDDPELALHEAAVLAMQGAEEWMSPTQRASAGTRRTGLLVMESPVEDQS